jgi:hypothetical protein
MEKEEKLLLVEIGVDNFKNFKVWEVGMETHERKLAEQVEPPIHVKITDIISTTIIKTNPG